MKHIKYLILTLTGLFIVSCDTDEFLNPLPDSAITVDSFFQTDDDVLSGIIGIYDALQGTNENTTTNIGESNRGVQFEHLLTEHRTDNTRNSTLEGSKSDFHRYVVNANNVESEDYYQSMYEVIFRANNILNFINIADQENQASYTAEAKFLRAYAYFKLVRLFGDVPLVTSVIGPTDNEALFTRISSDQIYLQIVEDLQEAVNVLDNSYKGRASRAAAQALLAKVYMTQPSPNYSGAQQLCEAIINSMEYDLLSNYNDVFYSELNDEIIFAIEYQSGVAEESQSFSSEFTSSVRAGREDGQNIVNANLRLDFEMYGGNRTATSITDINGSLPPDENEVAKFFPDGFDSSSNYGDNARNAGNDYIAIRFADVLLMHVESILGAGPLTTSTNNSAALTSFQRVRDRAGLTDVVTAVTKAELLRERRVELAFENQRYFDLKRFGVLDDILSDHSVEMGYTYDPRQALFLPIPQRERNISGGLLGQNPGY
ncbi:RagB/SusD family nutrient uptake outer membrane protein [Winogradskyella schleiferi]|uniref:RagB/SusD family nutrient uptake outer membrane protein n=1 Tax=Winogradskyella schleiferi TaxID=2686078 RepID=UPI0015BD2F34|nr:RagB/SusD family nutrient uptake outer membrane protein [Winogradskyella schleiferi]